MELPNLCQLYVGDVLIKRLYIMSKLSVWLAIVIILNDLCRLEGAHRVGRGIDH